MEEGEGNHEDQKEIGEEQNDSLPFPQGIDLDFLPFPLLLHV